MAIDHTSLHVAQAKFQDCLKLYLAALKPLGYEIRVQIGENVVALGSTSDKGNCPPADFWVIGTDDPNPRIAHLAFRAPGMLRSIIPQ
jgi:hypothetical protein